MKFDFFDEVVVRCPQKPMSFLDVIYSTKPIDLFKSDKNIQGAILLASPSLYINLMRYSELSHKKKMRCDNALIRYLTRLSSRCTPFGLFSGLGVVRKGANTFVNLLEHNKLSIHLEMEVVLQLAQSFLTNEEIMKSSLYYTNHTLYSTADHYKFVETTFDGQEVGYLLSSIEKDILLDTLIKQAHKGVSWNKLIYEIVKSGVSLDIATDYLKEIIFSQIIISELMPNLIGDSYLDRLASFLKNKSLMPSSIKYIGEIKETLINMEECQYTTQKNLTKIKELLEILTGNTQFRNNRMVYGNLNLSFSSDCSISRRVYEELEQTLSFLFKFSITPSNYDIENFKEVFLEVYGDNEVMLCEVLDPEMGIGYPVFNSSLITSNSDILYDFELPKKSEELKKTSLTYLEHIILNKLFQHPTISEIKLEDLDFKELRSQNISSYSEPMFVLFEILSDNQKMSLRLISFGVSSSCNLISRFASDNTEIKELCNKISIKGAVKGKKEDMNFLQISYLPNTRAGNVISHPHIREYEIPIGVFSTLDLNDIVHYGDLAVSIKSDKVVLKSISRNMYFVPVQENALNHQSSYLPVFRFLSDLQVQRQPSFPVFPFTNLINVVRRLPRIMYNNTILSPATWRLPTTLFSSILYEINKKSDEAVLSLTAAVFEANCIPSAVFIEDGDNKLYLNILSIQSIRACLPSIEKYNEVIFTEVLYNEDSAVCRNSRLQGHSNECIAFFEVDKLKNRTEC